jgi:protein PsiE
MTGDAKSLARRIIHLIEFVGLAVIVVATVVAGWREVAHMVNMGAVTLADLLLMFLYLEVLAMVGAYLDSGQLPVRMPLYIGIVALARYVILDAKDLDAIRMLAVAGAMLLMAFTVLVIRYGHLRYPYGKLDVARRPTEQPPG